MSTFERNRDVKEALDLGIAQKLPGWLKETVWSHEDYFDVWRWAMSEKKDFMFPYIVDRRGEKWYGNDTIVIGMEDNNGLLWESVSEMCFPAVEAILKVPNLFSEEILNMNVGTSMLRETFMRRDREVPYRATNLGAFAQLAMTQGQGDWKILDALKKYHKDEIQEATES